MEIPQVLCLFVCLFVKLFSLLIKFPLFVKLFSLLIKISFVCLFVKLFSLLIKISFVCLLSFFLPLFPPPSRQTNDKFGNFFSNFQGFTLVPWQKVGRIWLGFDGNPSSFPISPLFACISLKFFPSLSLYSNDMAPKRKSLIVPLWFGSQTLYFSFRLFKTQLLV